MKQDNHTDRIFDALDRVFHLMGPARCPMEEHPLTMQQVAVIRYLKGSPNQVSMTDLANYFGVTLPTMTGTINTLVKHGYVLRATDPQDRRRVYISLSPTILARLNDMLDGIKQKLGRVLSDIPHSDLEALSDKIEMLAAAAEKISTEAHVKS